MIEVALVAGMATFAVTTAVVEGDALAWFRTWGAWVGKQRWWFYYPLMPVRASHCPLCFSFWASIPFAVLSSYLSDWWLFPLFWFGGAGISILASAAFDRMYTSESSDLSLEQEVLHALQHEETEPP